MFTLEQKIEVIVGEFGNIDPRHSMFQDETQRRLRVLREAILFVARELQNKS